MLAAGDHLRDELAVPSHLLCKDSTWATSTRGKSLFVSISVSWRGVVLQTYPCSVETYPC